MEIKMKIYKKIQMTCLKSICVVMLLVLQPTHAKEHSRTNNLASAVEIIARVSELAEDFNLTAQQKLQIQQILFSYLPPIGLKVNTLINNRLQLLELNSQNDVFQMDQVELIATEQGDNITEIIILKEQMKREVQAVLSSDQLEFIQDLMALLISINPAT
jgi:hypothetical protein